MSKGEQGYLDLLYEVMEYGEEQDDRTGVGTKSIFGAQLRFNLREGFPLLTTKRVHGRSILYELLWFLKGDTNIRYLVAHGVHIWTDWPWKRYMQSREFLDSDGSMTMTDFEQRIIEDDDFAAEWGDLGPVYGKQWVKWSAPEYGSFPDDSEEEHVKHINQIEDLVALIKTKATSRRQVVTAWNPADLQEVEQTSLAWCHCLFQTRVSNGRLSLQVYQRSADIFLGVPFNIASYAMLTHMLAQQCGLEVGDLIWTGGDCHVYKNHTEAVTTQLQRDTRPLPSLSLRAGVKDIFSYTYDDFHTIGYDPHPAISAPVAV